MVEKPDVVHLSIKVHVTLMDIFRKYAAKRNTTITETVRRAGVILDEIEKADETPNTVIGLCSMDPKTGEVIKVRELRLIG